MILPHAGIPIEQWAANMSIDFLISFQPVRVDEDNWREFAMQINRVPSIAINHPPDPSGFTDWREWASRLIELNF